MTLLTTWDERLNEDTANCCAKQFGIKEENVTLPENTQTHPLTFSLIYMYVFFIYIQYMCIYIPTKCPRHVLTHTHILTPFLISILQSWILFQRWKSSLYVYKSYCTYSWICINPSMSFELSEKFQHDTIRMNFSEDSPPTYRVYRNLLTSQLLNCIFYMHKL